mmetsp:Transcript_8701/g.10979  ORF Transcript_8701/g.10979 Transcript_8701/m.10979 type:complete len:391 (+) Transcript_8701:74-1246(+)
MTLFQRICLTSFLFLAQQHSNVLAFGAPFAISSSQSPKKKVLTNKSKAGGGFGKNNVSVPADHTADTSKEIEDLIHFLTSQNSVGLTAKEKCCEVGISDTTNMRGLYASKDFKKNDIILKVPSDLVLALSDPQLKGADAPAIAHCGRNFMDMYLNNPTASQTWAPYLNMLPSKESNFDRTPDFFTDEEIDALELPLAVNKAKQRLLDIVEVCTKDDIPFDDLQFATWLVSSRCMAISIEDTSEPLPMSDSDTGGAISKPSQTIRVMVPFLDLINHSSDNANAEIHLIDPEKDEAWFAIRATRPIKKNKELTIGYGTAGTSVDLLQDYGFVPNSNRFDSYMLTKGGDNIIETVEEWSTTLEADEKALEDPELSANMKKVLEFRCKMKKSYS